MWELRLRTPSLQSLQVWLSSEKSIMVCPGFVCVWDATITISQA